MRRIARTRWVALVVLTVLLPAASAQTTASEGFSGFWYRLFQEFPYGPKYSGGLGTYTAKHVPLAVYRPEVERTYFVYGGASAGSARSLSAMVSYFDHASSLLAQPVTVHAQTEVHDPHMNPSISVGEDGFVWVFVSARGTVAPGYVYRSERPHDISSFERVFEGPIAYPQPWSLGNGDLLLLHSIYAGPQRELYWRRARLSEAGVVEWEPARKLARGGHYQISVADTTGGALRVATAFNVHPGAENADYTSGDRRTNLYFVQTQDGGGSWETALGTPVDVPLAIYDSRVLVRDYQSEGRLVYLKDMAFTPDGYPILLYLTASSHVPGPEGDPREWTVAVWDGSAWSFHVVTTSDHNYDTGSVYVEGYTEDDGSQGELWRVLAPTAAGPQPWGTGGEVEAWESRDRGATWERQAALTAESEYNHSYVRRPVDGDDGFYAFWADGDAFERSASRLYFADRAGTVWRMPDAFEGAFGEPESLTPTPDRPSVRPGSIGLRAGPNPTAGPVEVSLGTAAHIDVFNMLGEKVRSVEMTPELEIDLDLGGLASGTYVIRARRQAAAEQVVITVIGGSD